MFILQDISFTQITITQQWPSIIWRLETTPWISHSVSHRYSNSALIMKQEANWISAFHGNGQFFQRLHSIYDFIHSQIIILYWSTIMESFFNHFCWNKLCCFLDTLIVNVIIYTLNFSTKSLYIPLHVQILSPYATLKAGNSVKVRVKSNFRLT